MHEPPTSTYVALIIAWQCGALATHWATVAAAVELPAAMFSAMADHE